MIRNGVSGSKACFLPLNLPSLFYVTNLITSSGIIDLSIFPAFMKMRIIAYLARTAFVK
jgi:hypothetical protein